MEGTEVEVYCGDERRKTIDERMATMETQHAQMAKDIAEVRTSVKEMVTIFGHSKWAVRIIGALGIAAGAVVTATYYAIGLYELVFKHQPPPAP